jgi:hypothetical protein
VVLHKTYILFLAVLVSVFQYSVDGTSLSFKLL